MSTAIATSRVVAGPDTGRLPDFLVIGAAKSGTTTLHGYLCRHPQLHLSTPKEPEFFSSDEVYSHGEAWYRRLFAGAAADQLCGEASTTYTRWPHTADAASRIATMLPGVRLIYLMRHPVERAYSHYAHWMRYGVTMSFEEALATDSIIIDTSLYMRQIERYLARFERDRLLLLLLDDLRSAARETVDEVLRFLGVEQIDLVGRGPLVANRSGPDHFVKSSVTGWARRIPVAGRLLDRAPRTLRRQAYAMFRSSPAGWWLRRRYRLPPMQPSTRRRLLDLFADSNRELAVLMGRDLSMWDR